MPFGRFLPAEHGELSHLPLGHPDLPRPVCRGSTDLKANPMCPTKLKYTLDKQGERGVSLILIFFTTNLFFLKFVFLLSAPQVGGFLKTLFSEGIFSIRL